MKNAELAILGLIVEKPRYGYEIEQVIEARNMRDWTEIGFSSIYHILGRLEKSGYVEALLQDSAGRGPARKVYEVTEDGRSAWYEASLHALSTPVKCDQSFFLGLAALPAVPRDEALRTLDSYREQLQQRRDKAEARRQEIGDETSFIIEAMFDHSFHLIDAEMEWIEGFKERLSGARL
ncbi:MAG: PadR family transcriptional regulator [Candidatus Promineifilaceae bacterium]